MPHTRTAGRHRKPATIGLAALVGVAGATATAIALTSPASNAATEQCGGLDTALQNNLTFIASQRTAPDAQSQARIVNRQAVVDQIEQRRKAAGCANQVAANDVATQCAAVVAAAQGDAAEEAGKAAGQGKAAAGNGMAEKKGAGKKEAAAGNGMADGSGMAAENGMANGNGAA